MRRVQITNYSTICQKIVNSSSLIDFQLQLGKKLVGNCSTLCLNRLVGIHCVKSMRLLTIAWCMDAGTSEGNFIADKLSHGNLGEYLPEFQ